MPKISFIKNQAPIEVAEGANLMAALRAAGRPVASSCHGDGVCAKCRIQILKGGENLSPPNATETFLRERHSLSSDIRISCQTSVIGDIQIDTTYW